MLTDFCLWRGVVIPIVLAAVGAACLLTQTAWIPGRGGILTLTGLPGIIMGAMFLTWAFGLHVRHFWGYVEAITWWAEHLGITAYITAVGLGVYLLILAASHVMG